MKTYINIQYLRGLAAILVVVCHSMTMAGVASFFPVPIGEFGVDIFFVISGFIMWVTTNEKTPDPKAFWLARAFRIFPLYWLFCFVMLASIFLIPSAFFHQRSMDWVFVLKSFLLIPSYHPDAGTITPLYSIGWTLIYEAFFYVIFGLTLFVKNLEMRFAALVSAFIVIYLLGRFVQLESAIGVFYTSSIIMEFIIGVFIGALVTHLSKIPDFVAYFFLFASCILFSVGVIFENSVPRITWYGPASALLVIAAVILEKRLALNQNRLLLLLGSASYSIYLMHPFAQRFWYGGQVFAFGGITHGLSLIVYFIGSLIAGVVGGLMTYWLIEKPLLNRRSKKRRLQTADVALAH